MNAGWWQSQQHPCLPLHLATWWELVTRSPVFKSLSLFLSLSCLPLHLDSWRVLVNRSPCSKQSMSLKAPDQWDFSHLLPESWLRTTHSRWILLFAAPWASTCLTVYIQVGLLGSVNIARMLCGKFEKSFTKGLEVLWSSMHLASWTWRRNNSSSTFLPLIQVHTKESCKWIGISPRNALLQIVRALHALGATQGEFLLSPGFLFQRMLTYWPTSQ